MPSRAFLVLSQLALASFVACGSGAASPGSHGPEHGADDGAKVAQRTIVEKTPGALKRSGFDARDARDADERSWSRAPDEVPSDLARHEEIAFEVHLEGLVPSSRRNLQKRAEVGVGGGVVDEDVDLTEFLDRLRNERFAVLLAACVRCDRERIRADGVGHRLHAFELARRHHDLRAVLRERVRDGFADTATATGDDRDLPLEAHGDHVVPAIVPSSARIQDAL